MPKRDGFGYLGGFNKVIDPIQGAIIQSRSTDIGYSSVFCFIHPLFLLTKNRKDD
jgi:hypothetical protein